MLGLGNSLTSASYVGFTNTYSLSFDGTDDYVTVPDHSSLDITGAITISAWVKVNSFDSNSDGIVSKTDNANGHGYGLYVDKGADTSTGTAVFHSKNYNTAKAVTGALVTNTWYHIAGTFLLADELNKIYLDGSLVDSTATGTVDILPDNEALEFGRVFKDAGNTLNGIIDEVSIFDVVKTVGDLRDGSKPADLTGMSNLVGWWRMGDGTEGASGTTIYDMSANTNNGTMTNMDAGTDYVTDVP